MPPRPHTPRTTTAAPAHPDAAPGDAPKLEQAATAAVPPPDSAREPTTEPRTATTSAPHAVPIAVSGVLPRSSEPEPLRARTAEPHDGAAEAQATAPTPAPTDREGPRKLGLVHTLALLVVTVLFVRDARRADALGALQRRAPAASAQAAATGANAREAAATVLPAPLPAAERTALRHALAPRRLHTLVGNVRRRDDGTAPVSAARVVAVLEHEGRTYPLADGLTDEHGAYRLPALPPGRYSVLAHAPGFERGAKRTVLGGPEAPNQAPRAHAPPDDAEAAPPAASSARALFPDGLRSERVQRGLEGTRTTAPRESVSVVDFDLGPGLTLEGTLSLTGGATNPESAPGASVAEATNAPTTSAAPTVAGVVVRALREGANEGDEPPYAARADARGVFAFEGLAPGTYRVEVLAPGFEPVVRRGVPVPVREVRMALRALARIRGRVVDGDGRPIAAADVTLAGSGIWPARVLSLDATGTFSADDVPAGVYELRARAGARAAEPIAPLVLRPGADREVSLVLNPGATLRGRVLDASTEAPIANAELIVAEDSLSTDVRGARTDGTGSFTVPGLLRRPHQVSVRAPGYVARTADLAMPDGAEPLRIALYRAAELVGRVRNSNGEPIANAQLFVRSRDARGQLQFLSGVAESFRTALFDRQLRGPRAFVPQGELGVTVGRLPGVQQVLGEVLPSASRLRAGPGAFEAGTDGGSTFVTDAEGRFRVREVPPGTVHLAAAHPAYLRGESTELPVREGARTELELVLQSGGVILGRVLDTRGEPLGGQLLEVRVEHESAPRRVVTQRDGTFRVPVVVGRAVITAVNNGRTEARAEVTAADGDEVSVQLQLEGTLRVHGWVFDARRRPLEGAEVLARGAQSGQLVAARVRTGADGSFDLRTRARGAVLLAAQHTGFAPHTVLVGSSTEDLVLVLHPGHAELPAVFTEDRGVDGSSVLVDEGFGDDTTNLRPGATLRLRDEAHGDDDPDDDGGAAPALPAASAPAPAASPTDTQRSAATAPRADATRRAPGTSSAASPQRGRRPSNAAPRR